MENKDLQKAISQIKFPVRYDDRYWVINDEDDNVLIRLKSTFLWSNPDETLCDALGHTLAEMINGLDGRGNLQEAGIEFTHWLNPVSNKWQGAILTPKDFERVEYDKESDQYVVYGRGSKKANYYKGKRLEAPDRQVKSAEDAGHGICKEKNCEKFAVKDYNGHGHWVCDPCYESLSRHFDEEYR